MTEEVRELKIRHAPRSVEAVFCEGCECLIDDAVFDSPFEARDFVRQNLRDDGRILCGWCASPTNLERRRQAMEAAKQQQNAGGQVMKVIYIAGPITHGDIRANVRRADAAHRELIAYGFAVVNPMLTCWAGWTPASDPGPSASAHGAFRDVPYETWIRCGIATACRCDAVLRLPGESVGATAECAAAEACGVPVFTSVADIIQWRDNL